MITLGVEIKLYKMFNPEIITVFLQCIATALKIDPLQDFYSINALILKLYSFHSNCSFKETRVMVAWNGRLINMVHFCCKENLFCTFEKSLQCQHSVTVRAKTMCFPTHKCSHDEGLTLTLFGFLFTSCIVSIFNRLQELTCFSDDSQH